MCPTRDVDDHTPRGWIEHRQGKPCCPTTLCIRPSPTHAALLVCPSITSKRPSPIHDTLQTDQTWLRQTNARLRIRLSQANAGLRLRLSDQTLLRLKLRQTKIWPDVVQTKGKAKAKRSDLAKAKVKADQDLPRRHAYFKNYACSEKPMSVPVTKLFLQYVYIGGCTVRANGWGR